MRTFALIHLGRSNAGPNLLCEAAKSLSKVSQVSGIIFSAQVFEPQQILELDIPKLAVRTYDSKRNFLRGFFLLPKTLVSLVKFLKKNSISTLVFVMPHLWDPIIQPFIKLISKIELICWIHDSNNHPGESLLVHAILRKTNLTCANSLVTFSNYVEESIRKKTTKKLISLKLPKSEKILDSKTINGKILFIGRVNEYKGLDRLASAWKIVETENLDLHLTIAGSGGDTILDSVVSQHPNCEVIRGHLTNSEFDRLIATSTLVVIPYDEASQSGIVVKASEFGKPYVVTPIPGLIEQANLHGGGTVSKDMSPKAFANAILKTVKDGPDIPWENTGDLSWESQMNVLLSKLDLN